MSLLKNVQDKITAEYSKKYKNNFNQKARKRLTNSDFSIIAPNCIGGVLYHRLGLQFLSPTINLFFRTNQDYLRFVSDMKYYLSLDLNFVERFENYPTGMLDDVKIVFNHYKTEEEAAKKWNERKVRVNYDNLFIIMDDRMVTKEEIKSLEKVPCKGKVCFSANEYPDIDYVLPIKKYAGEKMVGVYMNEKDIVRATYPFDDDFDFVKWLNTGKF